MLNHSLAHRESLLNQISTVQIFVLDNSQILNNVGIKVVAVKAAIILQIVRVTFDVNVIEELIVLYLFFDLRLLLLHYILIHRAHKLLSFQLTVHLINRLVGLGSRKSRLARLLDFPILLSSEAFVNTNE